MAQTIWIHKLNDAKCLGTDGMDHICEHLFKTFERSGKLSKSAGWNLREDATTKEGATYHALFCDSCAKNYSPGHVRMAKEPVLV
jgi:hypothetical protein